jgi:hypothetical protein
MGEGMNPAFEEALTARLRWVDVVVLSGIPGFEEQAEEAIQAAYDAVHALASKDVLIYQHYGPRAPSLLLDVPELADQYNLAHEVFTECYHRNAATGSLGEVSAAWLFPREPLGLPYSKWLASVQSHLASMMRVPCSQVWEVINKVSVGSAKYLLKGWSAGFGASQTAENIHWDYDEAVRFEEEEALRRHLEDLADTYAHIEAELWAGWRSDFEDDQRRLKEV